MSIFEKWKSFTETVDTTTSSFRGCLWVVAMVGGAVIAAGKWLETLNDWQRGAFVVVLLCLLFIGLTYVLDWRRKRSIDSIPELLTRIDQMTLDYIDDYMSNTNTPKALVKDLAKLAGVNIDLLLSAAESQNKMRAEQEFERFINRYERLANPKKVTENILTLRLMGALMSDYNEGLASLTTNEKYQNIYQRIKQLQRRSPSAEISTKVNEYFHQSEGWYSLLLSIKPFVHLGGLKQLIPAKVRALSNIMRPMVEGHTATLIAAISESIEKHKNRGKEK